METSNLKSKPKVPINCTIDFADWAYLKEHKISPSQLLRQAIREERKKNGGH